MANDQDTAYILALHMAHQVAQQNGFYHTERALLELLTLQICHLSADGAKKVAGLTAGDQAMAPVQA
jgi:hypothetical protein